MFRLPAPLLIVFAALSSVLPGCEVPSEPVERKPPVQVPEPHGYPDPSDRPDGWAGSTGAPLLAGGYSGPVTVVHTRSQLLSALNGGGASASDTPKVIVIEGTIDLCSDAADRRLTPEALLSQAGLSEAYPSYDAWVAAYGASCLNSAASTLASAQKKLASLQKAAVVVKVGSHTTLLGKGDDAALVHGSLLVDGKTNVVIRNLTLSDASDWFPAWDSGENLVNSEYDNLSISNSTRVWVDHCRLDDGTNPDSDQPQILLGDGVTTKKWVVHDGLIDVVRGADLVTLSWNQIRNHDKTMLFGNSDSSTSDSGKLRVTVHHNAFEDAKQRLPRVRFGQVHVYSNWYSRAFGYAIGVGDKARVVSEANVFESVGQAFAAMDDATNLGLYCDAGSLGTGSPIKPAVPREQIGWSPNEAYVYSVTPAEQVKSLVQSLAGPRPWP